MATSSETQPTNPTRELAAIMFSDIAGYTAIMGRDEQAALRALDAHRGTLRSLLPKFSGRLIGEIGDGTLCSFHSAIDAVNCAREVQAGAEGDPELKLRIGIHLGDVVFTNNTVVGDGVNVAARLHALAPLGGICISANVYDEVRNKPGTRAKDLGEKRLKNVSRPIRVYVLAAPQHSIVRSAESISGRKRRAALGAVGALALVALAYGLMRWRSLLPVAEQQSTAARQIRSIAVLPLDNYSGDPNQEYFSDGMTDELTTDLAKISALRVISRSSVMQFKGEHRKPPPEIAKMLKVDAVIEGSVARSGNRVRINAQLIDAPADKHLWANSFERDSRDVLALEDELASAVAKEIEVQLTPDEQARLTTASTVNPTAYDAYLKGRYFFDRMDDESLKQALAQFEETIRLDPRFAPAYSGLSDVYVFAGFNDELITASEAIAKARAPAEKAIQLDDSLAEGHASLAVFRAVSEFDWTGSESEFRRAIALNPSYAYAHDQFGYLLANEGRFDEALAENKRAAELNPLSMVVASDMALTLGWQGKYEAAREVARKALDLDPTSFETVWLSGWIDVEAGQLSDAIPKLQKADAMEPPPWVTAWLGYAYGASHDRTHAMAMIEELNKRSLHGYVAPFNPAIIYLGLGDRERALDGLEEAYAAHSQWMLWLKVDRIFDPLRSEPRYITLLKKLNLGK